MHHVWLQVSTAAAVALGSGRAARDDHAAAVAAAEATLALVLAVLHGAAPRVAAHAPLLTKQVLSAYLRLAAAARPTDAVRPAQERPLFGTASAALRLVCDAGASEVVCAAFDLVRAGAPSEHAVMAAAEALAAAVAPQTQTEGGVGREALAAGGGAVAVGETTAVGAGTLV